MDLIKKATKEWQLISNYVTFKLIPSLKQYYIPNLTCVQSFFPLDRNNIISHKVFNQHIFLMCLSKYMFKIIKILKIVDCH
jgi:hypothetical protein